MDNSNISEIDPGQQEFWKLYGGVTEERSTVAEVLDEEGKDEGLVKIQVFAA